jgi:hypothetical protein
MKSADLELQLFSGKSGQLFGQDGVDLVEVVLVGEKSAFKVSETKLEEKRVVVALEDRVADVAHQVLEKGTDNDVDYLANLQVNLLLKCGSLVILLKVHATGNVLFSGGLVQLA